MALRRAEYQPLAIKLCERAFDEGHRRPLVVIPTGGGKTHVGKLGVEWGLRRSMRIIWLARGVDLIDQTSRRLDACGVPHGVVMRSHIKRNPFLPVQVCSVDTLRARGEAPDPTDAGVLIISDEAHHDSAETRAAIVGAYADPFVIGLTATPERGDRVALGEKGAGYQRIVEPVSIRDLQELWHETNGEEGLVPLHTWSTPDDRPRKRNEGMCESPLAMYQRICPGEPWIRFCESVHHARSAAEEARAAGYPAACVEGGLDCTREIEAFNRGELKVLTNVFRLTEGFDANVRVASIESGVSFFGAWAQRVGRILRPAPGKKHATLLDPYGHVHRGWGIEVPRAWNLDGERSKPAEYVPPLRQCLHCGCVARPGIVCVRCGKPCPLPENPKTKAEQARMVGVWRYAARWREQWNYFDAIMREYNASLGTDRPHKPQWVFFCFKAKFGITMPWKLTDHARIKANLDGSNRPPHADH